MSIELSGTASGASGVATTESQSGKGKIKSGSEGDTSSEGGFSALMTSLAPQPDQVDVAVTPLKAEEKTKKDALPAADPSAPLPPVIALVPSVPTDLAMLLAQAGQVAGSKLPAVNDEIPALGAKSGNRLIAVASGAGPVDLVMTAFAAQGSDVPVDVKQSGNALLDQMAQGLPGLSHKARGTQLQADVAAKLAESRAVNLSSFMGAVAGEPALAGALVTSGMGEGFLRQADKAVGKSSFLSSGYGAEGVWGQNPSLAGSRVDAPPVMADPSMLSLESKVADTVSYWVTQGIQNAQLKLDGFGGAPVEVNISLKGDEAHINFRTDQPEIRQMLEGAVAHLKEILTSEGLVLSGVSVGASGQDGAGAQEQRNRPGTHQAIITTSDVAPTESLQRNTQSVGRALDLFV